MELLLKEMRELVREEKTNYLAMNDIPNLTGKKIFRMNCQYLLGMNDIPNLTGKKIRTIYFGYARQDGVDEFIVGGVASEWELAEKEVMEDGRTRAEYWASFWSRSKIEEAKNTLMLLRENGTKTYIKCERYDGVFWCSDADRYVQYIICE